MTVLEEFHDQLYAAAQRQARRRTGLVAHLGTVAAVGLSVAVAVAVAVVVLTTVRSAPSTGPSARPASVVSSRRELLHTIAALRRPQTLADRESMVSAALGLQGNRAASGYPRIDRSLVRKVDLGSGGALTLVPMTFRPTRSHSHGLGERVTFTLHGPRIEGLALVLSLPGTDVTAASSSSVGALRKSGANLFTVVRHQNVGVVVVPDGVAEVKLSDFRVTSQVHVDPSLVPTVVSPVHDNVAVFHVAAPTVLSHGGPSTESEGGMHSTGAYARMTWIAADGAAIKRANILIAFNFIVRGTRSGIPQRGQRGALIGPKSVGPVALGLAKPKAVSELTSLFGTPNWSGVNHGCGSAFQEDEWGELAAEFHSGKFSGYRYASLSYLHSALGSPVEARFASRVPDLHTAPGISLGSTLAKLEDRYRGLKSVGADAWQAAGGVRFRDDASRSPAPRSSRVIEISVGTCGHY